MNDYELIYLAQEQNEAAQECLYQKYDRLINILISKKYRRLKYLSIDLQETYNECLNGLNDAIFNYNPDCNTTFVTFASVIIEKRINYLIRKRNTDKEKNFNKSLVLDFEYNDIIFKKNILDNKKEPLSICLSKEKYIELINEIVDKLSPFEYEVYKLILQDLKYQDIAKKMNKTPKQIDNAIQRIKNKLKMVLKSMKIA